MKRLEATARRCGYAATQVAVVSKVLGRPGRVLWPVVRVLTAAEQAAFGVADFLRR